MTLRSLFALRLQTEATAGRRNCLGGVLLPTPPIPHRADRRGSPLTAVELRSVQLPLKTSTGFSRCKAEASVRWQVRLQTLERLISITL